MLRLLGRPSPDLFSTRRYTHNQTQHTRLSWASLQCSPAQNLLDSSIDLLLYTRRPPRVSSWGSVLNFVCSH